MKKSVRAIASLVAAITITFGTSLAAYAADSSVTYEGGAEKFVFLPGSEYTDTDLFDNFKDVMPGDSLQETVIVTNDQKECDFVKIFMRAEVHDETGNPMSLNVADKTDLASMQDFLSRLSMTVWNGEKMIYQASPDELDGLQNNVLLGEFQYGESTELTVELNVPIELGNEYMNRTGEVDWVFVVEEMNVSENEPTQPETGDSQSIIGWLFILTVTLLTILIIGKTKNKRKM